MTLWLLGSLLTDALTAFPFPPSWAELFFSDFLSRTWLVAAVWLLLTLLGRFLWQLPFPVRSLRTAGRLCLTVLLGTLLTFLLNLLFLSLVYRWNDTLSLYNGLSGHVPSISLFHALPTAISFSLIYATALLWAGED